MPLIADSEEIIGLTFMPCSRLIHRSSRLTDRIILAGGNNNGQLSRPVIITGEVIDRLKPVWILLSSHTRAMIKSNLGVKCRQNGLNPISPNYDCWGILVCRLADDSLIGEGCDHLILRLV
jgi:hypothetical protein